MHLAALPGSLAWQPCPGSLVRQFDQFKPDLMRVLTRYAVAALLSRQVLTCF
jgi:hypothetical protein